MKPEFLIASFTGLLKTWVTTEGTRFTFKEGARIVKDQGYVIVKGPTPGTCTILLVTPPPYIPHLIEKGRPS